MSLTSFLQSKDKENCIKFQEEIKKITPKKSDFKSLNSNYSAFDTKRELKVEYNLKDKKEASLIGIEFDYLSRFRIAQIVHKNKYEAISDLVAENFFYRFKLRLPSDIFDKLSKKYLKAKEKIKEYIENKKAIDDELINEVYLLALLEQCWRGNVLPSDLSVLFSNPSYEFKEELKKLLIVYESKFIDKVVKSNSIVKYNPQFGVASEAIKGADADIYIDGTLYDFKCTKNIGYKAKDVQQVIGYYILDIIGKNRDNSRLDQTLVGYDIKRLAIYSARIGEIYYFDISNIENNTINNVAKEIEKILFTNTTIKRNNTKENNINKNKKSLKEYGKIIMIILLVILSLDVIKLLNNKKSLGNLNEDQVIQVVTEKDIINNFNNVKMNSQEILTRGQGFSRYYTSLVKVLRSYDVSEISNAIIVYELSDELLNDMYNQFKNDFSQELFSKITQEQLVWIDKKISLQDSLKDDELNMYKELITMTLNKCEEWTNLYK